MPHENLRRVLSHILHHPWFPDLVCLWVPAALLLFHSGFFQWTMQESLSGLSNYLLLSDSPTEDRTSTIQRCLLHPSAERCHEVLRDIFRNHLRHLAGRVPVDDPVLQCLLPWIKLSGQPKGRHLVNQAHLDGHLDHSANNLGDQWGARGGEDSHGRHRLCDARV